MKRYDFLHNDHLLAQLKTMQLPSQSEPGTEIYAALMHTLFSLNSTDEDLTETTYKIEEVVKIAQELYDQNRFGESLCMLTQLLETISNLFEYEEWYSMFDDMNDMDYSPAYEQVIQHLNQLLNMKQIPSSIMIPVKKKLDSIRKENILAEYTIWDLTGIDIQTDNE